MQLPLSSSLPSITDSEDGLLTSHLMLADANAELNRMAYDDFDEYSDGSPTTPQAYHRIINFNPEVNVRFIRPRSGTMRSSFSDITGTIRSIDSPLHKDCKQSLKESSPLSDDDEEFDRFYKTMESKQSLASPRSRRRLSMDETIPRYKAHRFEAHFGHFVGNRRRSLSCDNYFFQVSSSYSDTNGPSLSSPSNSQ